MALELYRCESPDCEYVTENPQADRCPLCGGTFFVKAEEGEVTPKGWLGLCREADRDGRQPDAYEARMGIAPEGEAYVQG